MCLNRKKHDLGSELRTEDPNRWLSCVCVAYIPICGRCGMRDPGKSLAATCPTLVKKKTLAARVLSAAYNTIFQMIWAP